MSKRHFATAVVILGMLMPGGAIAQTSLTLQQAVELALRNDSRVVEGEAKYRSAAREADFERAHFGPNLFTGTGALYTNGFPQTPGGAPPSVFTLAFTQTLLDGPARGRQRASEQRIEVRSLETKRIRDAVTFETASAYLDLAEAREALGWLRRARDSAQVAVDLNIERLREGRLTPIDVLHARLALARLGQRIVALESREATVEGQLQLLTGVPFNRSVQILSTDLPSLPDRSATELAAVAVTNSPEVRAAQLERRAREKVLGGERGGYWPSIDLIGNYSVFSRFNNLDVFFNRFQRHNVNVGVEARVPIFAAQTGAAIALARSGVGEADAEIRRRRDEIELSVRQAQQLVREAGAGREVAELELALAQEAVRVADARIGEGRADRLEREKAFVEAGRAWDGFFEARLASQRAQLALRRITGELSQLFP